ncbi:MAG: hypothetical protein H6707_15045 [Deltaproteobacteria bacterium]|nr:hypothetical protein [Deltaproteobacteria bacterium]
MRFGIFALLLCLSGSSAWAQKPTIAVLTFGGPRGPAARSAIVQRLTAHYSVLGSAELLAACDRLGIELSRGKNLAAAAREVGAFAVVGGSLKGRSLSLAIYSSHDGQPVHTARLPWRHRSRSAGKRAIEVIETGLAKVPTLPASRPTPTPPAAPTPVSPPQTPPAEQPPPAQPSPAETRRPPALDYSPTGDDTAPTPDAGSETDPLDDPLTTVAADRPKKLDNFREGPRRRRRGPAKMTKVKGTVGFGATMRRFRLNDARSLHRHPTYSSSPAFLLRLAVQAWPVAFFTDNLWSQLFLQVHYQRTLGMSSRIPDANNQLVALGTTISELTFDIGYGIKLGRSSAAPLLDLSAGYGFLNFGVNWGQVTPSIPSTTYRYLNFRGGMRFPFLPYLGAFTSAAYRFVLSSGDIEFATDEYWYGPAKAGALAFDGGLEANFFGVVARLYYGYTRVFTTFTDALNRLNRGARSAGGSLDQYHSFFLALGYQY